MKARLHNNKPRVILTVFLLIRAEGFEGTFNIGRLRRPSIVRPSDFLPQFQTTSSKTTRQIANKIYISPSGIMWGGGGGRSMSHDPHGRHDHI